MLSYLVNSHFKPKFCAWFFHKLSLIGIREPVFSFPHRKTQQATTRYISPSTSNSQKFKNWSERNLTLKSSVLPGNPPVSCLKTFQNLELDVATKSKNCPTLPKAFKKYTIKRIACALLLLFIPVFKKVGQSKKSITTGLNPWYGIFLYLGAP